MYDPNIILDKGFSGSEKIRHKRNKYFSSIYAFYLAILWTLNFIWISLIDRINALDIDIASILTNVIFFATVIGYALTGLGFTNLLKINRWILFIGILALAISSYIISVPIFHYYDR